MRKRFVSVRLTSLFLTLLMVASCFVALPMTASAAEDLNQEVVHEELDGPVWQFAASDLPATSGSANANTVGDFSVYTHGNAMKQKADPTDPKNSVWGVENSCSAVLIDDKTAYLSAYREIDVSVDLYFADFPVGTRTDVSPALTSDQSPLSIFKWKTKKAGASSLSEPVMLCVNSKGELFYANSVSATTGVVLPEDEWFNLRVVIRPAEGYYVAYVNDFAVYRGTFTALTGNSDDQFYFFDGFYTFTAYMKDFTVSTSNRDLWMVNTDASVSKKSDFAADHGEWSQSAGTDSFRSYTDPKNANRKVLGFSEAKHGNNSRGNMFIHDDENQLAKAAAFTISAEMYFESYPSGTYSTTDMRSPDDYPVSLVTWRLKTSAAGSYQFLSVRVNAKGELCTAANATSGTGVILPLGEWFRFEMALCPSTGRYQIFINGEAVYLGTFQVVEKTYTSDIRFYDGYFHYTSYVRYPSVATLDSPYVGVTDEASADYFGYQTKPITDGKFDIRFLSSVDPDAFSASGAETSDLFAGAGYEVTAVWVDKAGAVQSAVQRVDTDTIYRAVNTESGEYTLPGGDYVHAFAIRDVDATLSRIEFTVRPYTDLRSGGCRYGDSVSLLWVGEKDENGLPVLSRIEQISPYKTNPTDDTYVRMTKDTANAEYGPQGEKTTLSLKYVTASGSQAHYNRQAYFKFSFEDIGIERINESCRILFRVYPVTVPGESSWTAEEIAAGGVMARVNGCATSWSEDTLSAANYVNGTLPALSGDSWDVVLLNQEWVAVDVTDYVKACAASGSASFMMQLTSASGRSGEVTLRSSEYSSAPELIVYPSLLNYQTDLEKYANRGYEPWSYAEELVAEWVNEGYMNAYTASDGQLHLDMNEMASITDTSDNPNYTASGASGRFTLESDPAGSGETVLSLSDKGAASNGKYVISDTGMLLPTAKKFAVEADFMFTQFPSGTRDGGMTPSQAPLNVMRWMNRTGANNYGVRINERGEIYVSAKTKTGESVSLGQWFNIRIEYDTATLTYTVFLDGKQIYKGTFTGDLDKSELYLFDAYYSYLACVKDVRAYGLDGYATYDLSTVDNSKANGAYTIAIDWRANQAKNKINSRVYVRSIDTLASAAGYDKTATAAPTYGTYGGITNAGIRGNITGYFHTEVIGGRTYIIDPEGYPYFAVGMNTVELGANDAQKEASIAKYGSAEGFYRAVTDEFRRIGINTVWGGDWRILIDEYDMNAIAGMGFVSGYMSANKLSLTNSTQKFKHNNTMNVFDPDFETFSINRAITTVGEYGDHERIIGWTTDNEITASKFMLYDYLTLDATAPENAFSYAAAWTFLKARTGKANPSVEDVTTELTEEFTAFLYDRYYQVCEKAFEEAGVEQMFLGNRIHSDNKTSEGYLRAASQYLDALTVNLYGGPEPPIDDIEYMYKYSGKAIIVTEFYAKAQDALDMNGIPLMNQTNAGWVVETQEDRAAHYENYVMLLLESRCCVGWTWYRFRDNDQRVYGDAEGNIYVEHDYSGGAVTGYLKVGTYTSSLNADGKTYSYALTVDPAYMDVFENMDLSVAGDPYLPFLSTTVTPENAGDKLFVIHKGEYGGDNSNNGSNKGIYDNNMNLYQPLADAYARVDRHIMGLVNYFDALHGGN